MGGNIELLLPDDERERRLKGKRNARWAINVGGGLVLGSASLTATDQCRCQHHPPCCKDRCCHLLVFPVFDRLARRFSSRSAVYFDRLHNEQAGGLETGEVTGEVSGASYEWIEMMELTVSGWPTTS